MYVKIKEVRVGLCFSEAPISEEGRAVGGLALPAEKFPFFGIIRWNLSPLFHSFLWDGMAKDKGLIVEFSCM